MFITLQNTFVHILGISKEKEKEIWSNNIYNWNEFIEDNDVLSDRIHSYVMDSLQAYREKDFRFFLRHIPPHLHWRAYPDLRGRCCFLDIETTGLDKHNDDITVIGVYDGNESKFFVNGKNLWRFSREIVKYDMIVTFNGKCFDIPFIKSKFPRLDLNKFHVDLRFAMRRIGYTGGLKRIEKMMGLHRDDQICEVDGFEAVRLWFRYKKGDHNALDLLLRYNKADIENLKVLMDFTFEKLKEKEFLGLMS